MPLIDNIDFAGSGGWGAGLGRPLTRAEADGNIYSLVGAIQAMIDSPVAGVGIANITVVGRQLTIYMTDASTYGPFTLPVASPRFRGTWGAAVSYASFDIVRASGFGTYMVLQDHTSGLTFDPNNGNSAGFYYVQIGPDPFYTSQVLNLSATSLTLSLIHQNAYIRTTSSSAVTITLNADLFPLNAEIHFRQAAAGGITVTAGAGVTLNIPTGYTASTNESGAVFSLKQVATNVWDVFGKLAV